MVSAVDLTPESLVDLLTPKDAVLSPKGDKVVYSASPVAKSGDQTISSLWLAETSKERSARQITSGLYNDTFPQWSPDGETIAFVSDRHKAGESSVIYLQQMSMGEPVALTDVESKKGISSFKWSPNGNFIAYLRADEKTAEKEEREKKKDDANVYGKEWEFSRLHVLHVSTRMVSTLVKKELHVSAFSWSLDSKRIVYMMQEDTIFDSALDLKHGKGVQFEVVIMADGRIEHVLDFPGLVAPHVRTPLNWGDDGVYFLAGMVLGTCVTSSAVYRLDVDAKKYARIAYGETNDASTVVTGKGFVAAFVHEGLEDKINLVKGDNLYSGKEEIEAWDIVKKSDGEYTIVVATSTVSRPLELFTIDTTSKQKSIQLSSHGDAITAKNLGTSHILECKSYDGKVLLQGFYITPGSSKEKPSKSLPTAVLVHGGPSFRGTDSFQVPHFPWSPYILASGKYGVLIANYRGNLSQGEAHSAHVRGQAGTLEHDDIQALVDEAISQGFVDPDKVMIGGWSYGGLLSYLAAVRNGRTYGGEEKTWLYRGAICGAGICDWEMMSMTSDVVHFVTESIGLNPWTSEGGTTGRKGSAIWEMKKGAKNVPPCLILHGELDTRVPLSQAWAFQRACKFYSVQHEMVTYPREGHMVAERAHQIDMLKRVRQFCDLTIGG